MTTQLFDNLTIGLLDCWTVGHFDYWTIGQISFDLYAKKNEEHIVPHFRNKFITNFRFFFQDKPSGLL